MTRSTSNVRWIDRGGRNNYCRAASRTEHRDPLRAVGKLSPQSNQDKPAKGIHKLGEFVAADIMQGKHDVLFFCIHMRCV